LQLSQEKTQVTGTKGPVIYYRGGGGVLRGRVQGKNTGHKGGGSRTK
jgi:hypothetical protein